MIELSPDSRAALENVESKRAVGDLVNDRIIS
jgi:hypothetical protein